MVNAARRSDAPTAIDQAFQLAYRAAYRLMRVYWFVFRPSSHGALVTLWHEGELLLVRNSYVRYHSLPGGYVRRGETGREAAVRELAEEVGVRASADSLVPVYDQTNEWEGRRDWVEIFSLDVTERPRIRVDHREVIQAIWVSAEQALSLDLFPPARAVVQQRIAEGAIDRGQSDGPADRDDEPTH
jgi:8-oxo-dGTP diphosphatase